jgi:competence protein ComEC
MRNRDIRFHRARLWYDPENRGSGSLIHSEKSSWRSGGPGGAATVSRTGMGLDIERRPKVGVAPLVPVALAVVAGIVVDRYAEPFGTATWGLLALVGVTVALACWGRLRPSNLALAVACGAVGAGWHHHRWSDLAADDLSRGASEAPRPAWVRGVVREALGVRPGEGPDESPITRAVLDVTATCDGRDWHAASGRAQVIVVGDRPDLEEGEAVEAAGSLSAVAGPLNPGEFDFRGFLRGQGIRLRLVVDSPNGVWRDPEGAGRPLWRCRGAVRRWSRDRLVGGLDPKVAPLAAALLLGRREGVDPDVNDAFARTGTTHLLAISGLHLQVLALALGLVLRMLGMGRRGAFAAVGAATVAYALLVGLMPSVVRSAAMTVAVCAAGLLDRSARPANMLAMAALVTLLLSPADLFDVGCQLSFLAVAAIVWGVGPAADRLRLGYYSLTFRFQGPESPLDALERKLGPWWLRWLRRGRLAVWSGMVVSLVVWLASWPLVALRFHVVSPIGILLNVPLVPLTSLALMAAGLSLGLSAIWAPLGAPAGWACSLLLGWTESLVRWGAGRSWGHVFVPGPPWWWVVVFYVLLAVAAAAAVGRWPVPRWAPGASLGAWVVAGLVWPSPRPRALEAEVLAVGHGLAVVVQAGDGRAFVYDCGRMRDPKVGRRIVAPALWSRGVRKIDAVVLSHPDADHYNGLPDLLDRFEVGAVLVPPGFEGPANPGAGRLLDSARARGVPVRSVVAGDRWEAAGARFSVRHPPETWGGSARDNARSVVLDVESGGRHVLLTGDLEQEGLLELARRPGPPLDALLAPHHGGRAANPEWLYLWARPSRVIVSQKPPAPGTRDALAMLDAGGIPLLRTWQRGAIGLRWTPGGVVARGFLDGRSDGRSRISDLKFPISNSRSYGLIAGRGRSAWLPGLVAALGLAVGLGACAAMAVVEWGAWALVAPGRRLIEAGDDPCPGEPIEARGADGARLAGTWHAAPGATGRTVVLVHGFAERPGALHDRVEALRHHGWNVARPDLRGYGRSEGSWTSFGGREAGDLRAWIDVLAARAGPSPVVALWGRSMGSAIAVRAAAEDARIAALVLESPYADLEATIAAWLRRARVPLPRAFALLIARRAAALAGVSLTRPRPIDLAPGVTAPTLVIHGADDRLVPLVDARHLADAFPRPAPLIEVPGAGHTDIIDVGGPDLLGRIVAFLQRSGEWRVGSGE